MHRAISYSHGRRLLREETDSLVAAPPVAGLPIAGQAVAGPPDAALPVAASPDAGLTVAGRQRTHTPEILVLADDLSGACDSGSAFLRSGRTVRVWIEGLAAADGPGEDAKESVWVFSTATRNSSEDAARKRVEAAAKALRTLLPEGAQTSGAVFFKKVDSAGRGNIGAEVLQASESLGCDLILFAPAFPRWGRVVRNGVLHVGDLAGQNTSIPLTTFFPRAEDAALVGCGSGDLLQRDLRRAQARGARVWLCDAETQEDLRLLVEAVRRLPLRVLWAGSAGLASALADARPVRGGGNARAAVGEQPLRGSTLVFAGTHHAVTQVQLEWLTGRGGAIILDRDSDWLGLSAHNCVLIRVACGSTSEEEIRSMWNRSNYLGGVASLVLTGGDTAAMVLRALGAESIEVLGEVVAGVPWGRVSGGLADGRFVVTKSGGFGDEMALVEAVKFLQEQCQ